MGKAWSATLIALAIGGCGARASLQPAPSEAGDCNRSEHKVVSFTAPDAQDVVEAKSIGPDCKSAIVLISVRRATGEPLWAWASPDGWPLSREASGPTPAAMEEFLKNWASVRIDTTLALPDWPERAIVYKDQLGPFMHTPFDRDQYVEIRNKALPRLCYATGVESGLCIYYDPSTGAAAEVFRSGS